MTFPFVSTISAFGLRAYSSACTTYQRVSSACTYVYVESMRIVNALFIKAKQQAMDLIWRGLAFIGHKVTAKVTIAAKAFVLDTKQALVQKVKNVAVETMESLKEKATEVVEFVVPLLFLLAFFMFFFVAIGSLVALTFTFITEGSIQAIVVSTSLETCKIVWF